MKKLLASTAVIAVALAMTSPASFAGQKKGFASTSTQGSGGKENPNANPSNQGQTTITGPKGQVKQGKTANTTVDKPGAKR